MLIILVLELTLTVLLVCRNGNKNERGLIGAVLCVVARRIRMTVICVDLDLIEETVCLSGTL